MIRHGNLSNPIKQTRVMRREEFEKYIALRDEQLKNGTTTDPRTIIKIHDIYFDTHQYATKSDLKRTWQEIIQPMVTKNSALAQFILDYGGAESDFFFPWLETVATSPSGALEMAYAKGYDYGDFWRSVPESDKISDFVHNVPTFVYQRERQLLMADLASSAKDNGTDWCPAKVVDLGAGRMAWSRYHGFKFDSDVLKILAVDKDPAIRPEELFGKYGADHEAITGVSYDRQDILPWLATTGIKDIDLVMLGGVASYFPLAIFTEAIIKPVHGILKENGAFFFDLQLDCPQYEWTIKLFGWPEMRLMKSAEEAIAKVETVRRGLWDAGLKFSATYSVDTPNKSPSAVMIIFQKI